MQREQEKEEAGRDQQRRCALCHQMLGGVIAIDFIATRKINVFCGREVLKTWFLSLGRKLFGNEALVPGADFNGLFN